LITPKTLGGGPKLATIQRIHRHQVKISVVSQPVLASQIGNERCLFFRQFFEIRLDMGDLGS